MRAPTAMTKLLKDLLAARKASAEAQAKVKAENAKHNSHVDMTRERAIALVSYDPETGIFRHKMPRQRITVGSQAGSLNSNGYLCLMLDGVLYKAHRLAWLMSYGSWPTRHIDHINCIKTDNRLANLRDVSHQTNMQNFHHPRSNNKSSGVLGVTLDKRSGKFVARICIDGKMRHIGCFAALEEAHEAYLQMKRKHHIGFMG